MVGGDHLSTGHNYSVFFINHLERHSNRIFRPVDNYRELLGKKTE